MSPRWDLENLFCPLCKQPIIQDGRIDAVLERTRLLLGDRVEAFIGLWTHRVCLEKSKHEQADAQRRATFSLEGRI